MKNLKFLFVVFITLFLSCNKEKKVDYVIFSGKIEDVNIDSLMIYDKDYKPIQTILLSKELTFNDTLFIPEGYYYLGGGKTAAKLLFLKPSFNLKTKIFSNNEDFSISFGGNGSEENNYLQEKEKNNKIFKLVIRYNDYMSLNEKDFLKLSDSINNEKINFLNSYTNLDDNFKEFETFSLKYENSLFIDRYSQWKGEFIGDKGFSVSKDFPNPYKNFELSNEKMLVHPNYLSSIFLTLNNKHKIIYRFQDINLDYLQIIDDEINSQIIKDELIYECVKQGIDQTKELDSVYAKFMAIVKNQEYKNDIKIKYLNLKKMAKGIVSPIFELYDINNRLVTLESLKGKLVYIDIWGTWCIPCIQEIPSLKKIEKEFRDKDIYFVSICIRDKKEKFEEFVKENELSGIQLFAPDTDISFFEEYQLKTVPRFILIDKEGKILDANAYKPSDPKLKEQILEYL
ncbi:MAG: TlpA family protein disulfide reductase [Lutibacter sp.]